MNELREIHYSNLERKRIYIVKSQNGTYKGMYLTQPKIHYFPYIILTFVTLIKNGEKCKIPESLFDIQDKFYDAEKYINVIAMIVLL